MDKQKHFFTLFLGTGLNIILGVITTPIVTRLVNPDVYGELSLFTLYGSILMVFTIIGQDQAYNRYYYSAEGMEYKRYLLGLTAKVPLIISAAASIAVCIYFAVSDRTNYVIHCLWWLQ